MTNDEHCLSGNHCFNIWKHIERQAEQINVENAELVVVFVAVHKYSIIKLEAPTKDICNHVEIEKYANKYSAVIESWERY